MDFVGLRVRKLALPIKHHIKKPFRSKKKLKIWGFFPPDSSNREVKSTTLLFNLFTSFVVVLLQNVVSAINIAALNSGDFTITDSLFHGCVENPLGRCRVQLSHAVLISGDIDTSFTPLWWCDLEMTPNVSKCEQASDVSGWVSGSRPVTSRVGFQPTSFVSSHILLQIVASHLCLALVSLLHSHRMKSMHRVESQRKVLNFPGGPERVYRR